MFGLFKTGLKLAGAAAITGAVLGLIARSEDKKQEEVKSETETAEESLTEKKTEPAVVKEEKAEVPKKEEEKGNEHENA